MTKKIACVDRATAYGDLSVEQKDQIFQVLRVWLRYRAGKVLWRTSKLPKSKRKPK